MDSLHGLTDTFDRVHTCAIPYPISHAMSRASKPSESAGAGQCRALVWGALLLSQCMLTGCHNCWPSCLDSYWRSAGQPFDTTPAMSAERTPSAATGEEPVPDAGPAELGPRALQLPSELPGADAPRIQLPPYNPADEQWRKAIQDLYPQLQPPPAGVELRGESLTLAALQAMALDYNPRIREAAASVEAARGAMVQAGLYPNPSVGYQADTVNTANTNGYHGAYWSQTFVTMGKVRLAQESASMELANAELALKRVRVEVASQVRSRYFATLVLAERRRLARALADLSERVFRTQVEIVQGGEAAPYEPMQLRVLALQTRAASQQAEQQYLGAWRQLAASLGLPDLPPSPLAGRVDDIIPRVEYERLAALMMANHSDLQIAQNSVTRAHIELRLAQVTPVPDLSVNTVVQRDHTFVPGTTTYNLQLGGEIPVFNRNQGNVIAAQAEVSQAEQAVLRVQNDLLGELGEAFGRYEANRFLVQSYGTDTLRDQVRVYRGVYERYRQDPAHIQFNDIVVAQQTLASLLTQYLDALGNQWQALVDLGRLVQADDLFALGEGEVVAAIPDLSEPGESR